MSLYFLHFLSLQFIICKQFGHSVPDHLLHLSSKLHTDTLQAQHSVHTHQNSSMLQFQLTQTRIKLNWHFKITILDKKTTSTSSLYRAGGSKFSLDRQLINIHIYCSWPRPFAIRPMFSRVWTSVSVYETSLYWLVEQPWPQFSSWQRKQSAFV